MVFGNDYITKMVSSFASVVAQLLGLKKERKHQEIFKVINDTLEKYYRLNSKLIQSLSNKDLLALMRTNGILDNEKTLTIAYLLNAEGESYEAMGETDESYRRYLTSLTLYLAAADNEANARLINYHSQIEDLLQKLSPYELPNDCKFDIFAYLVIEGRYDAAETLLFDFAETESIKLQNTAADVDREDDVMQRIMKAGLTFYDQLLLKDNALLIQGGLPRDEVIEGCAQFKQLCADCGVL